MKEAVEVRIEIRATFAESYFCGINLDKDVVRGIIEKAGGRGGHAWECVRNELRCAIEQTLLNWADKVHDDSVQRVRNDVEILGMELENARRREEQTG